MESGATSNDIQSTDAAKRKTLQCSIASLCVENGYLAADNGAIEVLTQLLQAYISEVGRSSRAYCEMAQRVEPTVADVHMALIDEGSKYDCLDRYAMRFPRRHLSRQQRSYPTPQPKSLQVGVKSQRLSHIPSHLPPLPDQHTYIKTPIFASPEVDYRAVKERMSDQQYNSTKSLSKLLAKTKPSKPIAGEVDASGQYCVLLPDEVQVVPSYISSLVLPETNTETVTCPSDVESSSNSQQSNEGEVACGDNKDNDSQYVNPYLKPAVKSNSV